MSVNEAVNAALSRPNIDEYFLSIAYQVATRGTCDRKFVGAVIVDQRGRLVSTGYNGAPAGQVHCSQGGHVLVDNHCVRSLHAESNAIDYAGREARGCHMYCTIVPCFDCAKRIVNAGVTRVVWHEHYESRYGKSSTVAEYLYDAGVSAGIYDSQRVTRLKEFLEQERKLYESFK